MTKKREKLSVYLAGGIQHADGLGAGWRTEITPLLEKIGLEVHNPVELEHKQLKGFKPNRLPDFYTNMFGEKVKPDHWHDLSNASERHLYNRFLRYMRRIIHFDLDMVENHSDYIICLWNEGTARGAGTHSELAAAFRKHIPIYCVATCEMPAWAKACCTEIFLSVEDMIEFLKEEFDYSEI